MNKVLIVDDEPMIRNGLTTLVDWEKYGFAIAGTGANGSEAIEKHRELSPDLMLIDIRMPGMDGLQAISEIRRTDTQCHILILSGYADFNYAKQAIAQSVDGYILKPIDEDELESYVERVSVLLKQRFEQQVISDQSVHLLREELLQEVALGRSEGESKLKDQQGLFGDPAKSYQLLLIDLYSREHSLSIKAAVRKKLEARIEQERRGWVFSSEPYVGIVLKDYALQQETGEQMENLIKECCGERVRFTAVTAESGRTLNEVHASAGEIRRLLKQRFLLEGGRIHFASTSSMAHSDEAQQSSELQSTNEDLIRKLYYALDIGSVEGTVAAVAEASEQILMTGDGEQAVKSAWAQLLTAVLSKAATANPQNAHQEDLTMITQLYLTHHYKDMLAQLERRLSEIAERIGRQDSSSAMKRMTDFIERHHNENLKLETLAELFSYNSGYLGKLFKSHTGEHFNTYLDQVRIEHAIKLLQEGLKVHQVSERVGYANVDYFHSKFKKYKGVSPSSFKNLPARPEIN